MDQTERDILTCAALLGEAGTLQIAALLALANARPDLPVDVLAARFERMRAALTAAHALLAAANVECETMDADERTALAALCALLTPEDVTQ